MVILHRFHDLPVAVGVDDPSHGSDREDLARLEGGMELGKVTIWFAMDSARAPPTWRATVDEIWSAVYRGVCPR